jgi:hypothetical protein
MTYPAIMLIEERWNLQSRYRREPCNRAEIARRLAEIETRIVAAARRGK